MKRSISKLTLLGLSLVALAFAVSCGEDDSIPPPMAADSPQASPAPTPSTISPPTPDKTPVPAALTAVQIAVPNNDNLQWMNYWMTEGAGFFREEALEVTTVAPSGPMLLFQGVVEVAMVHAVVHSKTHPHLYS